ncbi:MAG TPA: pentapeptide repeat-containing protein [Gaiellaceae bacterium]|jgi:hypothetical protein|nr:pentapeptide repeat-containing protein [Gaiellaceae bacterium]
MGQIQIVSWWDSRRVLWEGEAESTLDAVTKAKAAGADLGGADLRGADLGGADLRGAYLGGAYLGGADLGDADLSGADLGDADLGGADLGGAYLRGADLGDAYLRGADLGDAYLGGAYLGGADLGDADLGGADQEALKARGAIFDGHLDPKADLWAVLDLAPAEAAALRTSLLEGKVNGSVYKGACACLVGTIANARGCHYDAIPGLVPDSSRPAERWFLSIRPGRTPQNSSKVRRTVEWIDEWAKLRAEAIAVANTEADRG